MAGARTTRRARWFVTAGLGFLVLWQTAVLANAPTRTTISLGLLGFVFHTLFGKAYALIPTYFERDFQTPKLPAIQLPLSVGGVLGLASAGFPAMPDVLVTVGAIAWMLGVIVFIGGLSWTIRDNLLGAETGTGAVNDDRSGVDRYANAFVPIALGYLVVGSYALLGQNTGLPTLFDGYVPRSTHLLAAGVAVLLLFAVGFRLLPRFLVATPPRGLVWLVLPAGALGPIFLAATLPAGDLFPVAAAVEAIAVLGFATAYIVLFVRSDRRRVGFYGVLLGILAGVLGTGLAVTIAIYGIQPAIVTAHRRLNLLGFLGLSIMGVSYQFYPPNVGSYPGASDWTALGALVAVGGGLGCQVIGVLLSSAGLIFIGELGAIIGASIHMIIIVGLFAERYWVR